ncbi:hypothetical protein FRC07_009157 [Ceratobasidium sp. 392]|nr:hypothetical protein FRC07_009157 [Ceratobasidium sp. 392]
MISVLQPLPTPRPGNRSWNKAEDAVNWNNTLASTFPPNFIALLELVLQMAKEFCEVPAMLKTLAEFTKAHISHFCPEVAHDTWWPLVKQPVEPVHETTLKKKEDKTLKSKKTLLLQDLPILLTQVIKIQHAHDQAEKAKIARKEVLKNAADVDMDVDKHVLSPAVKAEVLRLFKQALNNNPKAGPSQPKGKVPKPTPSVRAKKKQVGHTNPKTGLTVCLHYGPKQQAC